MSSAAFLHLTSLPYLDVTPGVDRVAEAPYDTLSSTSLGDPRPPAPPVIAGVQEEEMGARIDAACVAERSATTQRLEHLHTQLVFAERQEVTRALAAFAEERSSYFARVESDVVHLSLAIARKILGREAQTDPLSLAGLVRVALDGVQSGSSVRLRVAPERLSLWQEHVATMPSRQRPDVVSDAGLLTEECVLETDAGMARLSYEIQLKEIERGFLDLLGRRPGSGSLIPAPTPLA